MKRVVWIICVILFVGCASKGDENTLTLFPDYSDVTIPYNIAPLNFRVEGAKRIRVKISGEREYSFTSHNELISFPLRAWKRMLSREMGNSLHVALYVNSQEAPFAEWRWRVSADAIDPYLSYRLIEPAYEVWNGIVIEERNIENFRTRTLADNRTAEMCCVNCHTTNKNGTSFMHLRGGKGGTIVNRDGNIIKINTRTDRSGGAVYGDISPDGRYGIFATADIKFAIHSHYAKRMEVYDSRSDLVLIDFDSLTASNTPAVNDEAWQESFPCFSADGGTIFFCRARHKPQPDSLFNMRYDIAAIQFDKDSGRLRDRVVTVLDADRYGASFSHLKCSPDGNYLMMTAAAYGTFPIWHEESELWLLHLKTGRVDMLKRVNEKNADTYHSWSSNSRWVVFASKRDDKVYGRPYIVYIDAEGRCSKPFLLPQRNPQNYNTTLKSYNIPELSPFREKYNARHISSLYCNQESLQVEYRE